MVRETIYIFSLVLCASFCQRGLAWDSLPMTISYPLDSSMYRVDKIHLDTDSSRNCCTVLAPWKTSYAGYVVLLPGFGETADRVLNQSGLAQHLANRGYLTIIPTLQDGIYSFGIDQSSQSSLERIIDHARNKYALKDLPFFMGGYSIGGSCIIKYAEEAELKPLAVFAIDPPIDFEQVYYSCKRQIRLSISASPNQESVFLVEKIKEVMEGSPEENIKNYFSTSPYSLNDEEQTAVKKLLNTPIRIYTEPDIQWWMTERHMDFTNMNSTYHSAFINELQLLGHQNAQLITTTNKGFRQPDHQRHPHSWSIVDSDELILWLETLRK